MRGTLFFLAVVLAWSAAPRPAGAEVRAELVFGTPARVDGWEALAITWDAADFAGAEVCVSVQDARGGLRVVRVVQPVKRDSDQRFEAILALPLLATAELRAGEWPVEVAVRSAAEAGVSQAAASPPKPTRVVVNTGTEAVAATAGYRVAVSRGPEGQREWATLAKSWHAQRPAIAADFSEEDLIAASPLLFAGCDAVLLTPATRDRITEARAAELMNVGVQLIVTDGGPPRGGGGLARFVWDHLAGGAWVTPEEALRRLAPRVVEPGLAEVPELVGEVTIAPATRWLVLLLAPAACGVLLLARGLFCGPRQMLVAVGTGMGLLALVGIAVVHADDAANTSRVAWRATLAQGQTATAALHSDESLTVYTPRFACEFSMNADDGTLLVPVAASTREYFRWRDVELLLDVESAGNRTARLTMPAAARQAVACETRSLAMEGVVPVYPVSADDRRRFSEAMHIDLDKGWWLRGGYLLGGSAAAPSGDISSENGELFSHWAARQTSNSLAARAWYALRFDAAHRYFFWIGSDGSDQKSPALYLIDFGAAPVP